MEKANKNLGKGGRKMDTKKSIRIFKDAEGWSLDFGDDPMIRSVFDTTVIPTPYTAKMPAANVLKKVQELNPNCNVYISGRREEK